LRWKGVLEHFVHISLTAASLEDDFAFVNARATIISRKHCV
jgi:hypothetical protein